MQVWYHTVSLVTSSESKKKFVGKIFVRDTLLGENFSWMEANHENEINSTMKIFTYTVMNSDYVAICPLMMCACSCVQCHCIFIAVAVS